jgi:hypothetical protein
LLTCAVAALDSPWSERDSSFLSVLAYSLGAHFRSLW